MLFSNLIRGEDRDKRRRRSSLFNVGAAVSILALHQAHDSDDFESESAGGLDRVDGRAAGGANIVNDDDGRARLAEALNALSGAVLLFRLADEKTVQRTAGHSYGNNNRIGSHGEAANRGRFPFLLAYLVEKDLAHELSASGIQRGGAAVDVIVARRSGRQLEFTEAKRLAGEHSQELLAGGGHEFLR